MTWRLASDTVAIWIIDFARVLPAINTMAALLSPEEKSRSNAFYFPHDSRRFICARGVLRTILGSYADVPPHSIRFSYAAKGKPLLANPSPLEFNLSHTKKLIAIAVTYHRAVGIDIEACIELSNMNELAQKIMRNDEYLLHLSLRPREQLENFYQCWVRKEAVSKAWGSGLYSDLQSFAVTRQEGARRNLVCTLSDEQNYSIWCVAEFTPNHQHVGAVCLKGKQVKMHLVDEAAIDSLF